MAYIAPNSVVHILRGIPWNNTYQDTAYFESATDQYNYMIGKVKYTFNAQSYQRANKNTLKLNRSVEDFYDCNYIMFQNTSFGNKWFYGFITNVTYVNNDTTRIQYELDVLQTWHFDYEMKTCFIVRQHTPTDGIGEYLMDEDLEIGELFINKRLPETVWDSYVIVVAATCGATWDGTASDWVIDSSTIGQMQDLCYSGVQFTICQSALQANKLINKITEVFSSSSDAILGIFMYPFALASTGTGILWQGKTIDTFVSATKPGYHQNSADNRLNGYLPKNKRLYSYPYSQIMVTDGGNQVIALRPELFREAGTNIYSTYGFSLKSEKALNPTVALIPRYYKTDRQIEPYNAIMMTGFPMCNWTTDMFKAYVAQTYGPAFAQSTPQKTSQNLNAAGAAMSIGTITSAIGGAMSKVGGYMQAENPKSAQKGATDAAFSAIKGDVGGQFLEIGGDILTSISDKVKEVSSAFLKANQSNGRASDTSLVNFGFKGWRIYELCPKKEFCEMIDSFFTMFGYAIKKLGVPNRKARPYWTFIKTDGCKIEGSIPFDHEAVICNIYDRGVTFWTNPALMYQYGLDNSPAV